MHAEPSKEDKSKKLRILFKKAGERHRLELKKKYKLDDGQLNYIKDFAKGNDLTFEEACKELAEGGD